MSEPLRRREFIGGVLGGAAALTLAPWGWAAVVTPAQAAQGLLVRPYLQPGPHTTGDVDAKDLLWLADPRAQTFTVEYGWEGGPPAPPKTAPVRRTDIQLAAPTPAQLKAKPTVNPLGQPHEIVATTALDKSAQHYAKYHATLAGLPTDVTAWYHVKLGTQTISKNSFKTRASATKSVSFIAVGDLAVGKTGEAAVAYQASLLKPDFFLALGDLCYPLGRVSQYMNHYFGTYANVDRAALPTGAPLMETVPFYALLGNHDVDTGLKTFPDCLGIYYFFHAPHNGPGPGKWSTPIGKDPAEVARFRAATAASYPSLGFYSFDQGPAHFAVVDSNAYCKIDTPELLAWLERDLNASKLPWKFIMMHAPMFQASPAHYTEQKMRLLSNVIDRCGVDVVFAGHVHNYQRSRPMRFKLSTAPKKPGDKLVHGAYAIDTTFDGATNTRPNGTIHIVSGGGGASLIKDQLEKTEKTLRDKYGDNWSPYTAKHIVDRHSFVACDLTPRQLTVRAIDQDGKEIDRVIVTKA
jgi:hypothetical protein